MASDAKAVMQQRVIHRIHRIQGQLNGLTKAIEDEQSCEYLIIQTRAVEKAVASLIVQMIENQLLFRYCEVQHNDPEQTAQILVTLSRLVRR